MQHDFEIVTDSTCDIPLPELAELNVEMVPLHVFVGEDCYLDQIELTPDQFYDKMAQSEELPHSSQPAPTAFQAAFAKLSEAGAKRILSIHIATALSGTANSAELAAETAGAEVRVWDSRTATVMHGLLVREAAKMRDAGETLEATIEHLEKIRANSMLIFMLDTLENIVKNGRCSRAKGLMSSLLNIKAVLDVEDDGSLLPVGKGRGQQRALEALSALVEERFGKDTALSVSLLTVRNFEGCDEVIKIMKDQGLTIEASEPVSVGPVIATHTGAGLVGTAVVPTELLYK